MKCESCQTESDNCYNHNDSWYCRDCYERVVQREYRNHKIRPVMGTNECRAFYQKRTRPPRHLEQ